MKDKDFDILEITEKDIFNQLQYSEGSSLFLNKYTLKEMFLFIEKLGLVKKANKLGFKELKIDLESSDVALQRLTIYDKFKNKDHLIVDLLIKIENFAPTDEMKSFFGEQRLKFLTIEWLTLQNPKANFTEKRKKLPGQKHPGLGIKRELYLLFRTLARDLDVDGIQAKPQFFHNAMMYRERFKFLHPEKEGEFRAVYEKFIEELGFVNLAWAVYENCIRYGLFSKTYMWKCDSQIFPIKRRILEYFESANYKKKVNEAKKKWMKVLKLKKSCLAKIDI